MNKELLYLSIDIETTGLVPHENQILEIGLVGFTRSQGIVLEKQIIIDNGNKLTGHPWALHNAHDILEAIIQGGDDVGTLESSITTFDSTLDKLASKYTILPVGKNLAMFDIPFLRHHGFNVDPLGFRVMDVGVLAAPLFDFKIPGMDKILKKMHGSDKSVSHRALDDAHESINILNWVMDNFKNLEEVYLRDAFDQPEYVRED